MKLTLRLTICLLLIVQTSFAQITTPVIRAAFGVDGELRSHYFSGAVQLGNDDWFNQRTAVADTGRFVIDTTGAAAIVSGYTTQPASRRLPFYRGMRYPQYSVVNNRLLLDAVMIRDYHGDDSTVFASGSNKNGDSPFDWSCPISQGIPDKNDILDMFVHIRRAGPNSTDSLWMFGGLSLDNTTGNRYFDFEMYQTDIYYDRGTRKFYGYGPDAGHTRWQFDAAGNVTVPGDIIFSAAYQSSSLTMLEARIWIDRASLSITPAEFNWSGQFDGAASGSQYGYASILPKTAGTYYTGLQCNNNTWGGPFSIVLQNDNLATNYTAGQFVEFSVNLTKLGLDPVTLLGGNVCGMPFRRILVKTRASSSFTAELKDFVGPFDLFLPDRVEIETETPIVCYEGTISEIYVTNPVSTAIYQWTTTNGHIVGSTTGTNIFVDEPGTYIVHHYLQAGCSEYATDTVQIIGFATCEVLERNLFDVSARLQDETVKLNWTVLFNQVVDHFEIERSADGINFTPTGVVEASSNLIDLASYIFDDMPGKTPSGTWYYRVKLNELGDKVRYSSIMRVILSDREQNDVQVLPNPSREDVKIQVFSMQGGDIRFNVFNSAGKMICTRKMNLQKGYNSITLDEMTGVPAGVYHAMIFIGNEVYPKKILKVD